EKLAAAVPFLQRARKLRPEDADILEKLFQLFTQLRRHDEARQMLQRLRQMRPNDPQFELYELDLHESRSLSDIDRMVSEVKRITGKCLPLVKNEEHRRIIRDLGEHIDHKIDLCQSIGR